MAFRSSREPRNSRHPRKASKWVPQYTDASSASDISMSDSDQDDVRLNGKSNKALVKNYRNGSKWTVELGSDEDEAQDFEDTPLLLIGFEKFGKKKVNLKLHTDVLDRVLKTLVDDLPLSIINIIGPAGLGKSFTLNYVIKKLEAIQNQEKNWMGWDSAHNSFDGFPVGKKETNGTSNQGIYIWPQPFVMNTEHGRVAVLVTETNGLHDDTFDTQEALTSIFCLSLLTSSVVIYNTCESQLTEDSFLPLIPYIRFGKKIHESFAPNYEPPFQVLSFLIRDWDDQTEYCCGASDGKKFLQDKLRSNLDDATAKYIAKCMKEYFSSVDCFLLPPAGDIITSEDFNGCPDRLDSEFAKKLEKYINALVSTTHLPAKQVYKMKINSGNFKQFLNAYIQLFNS
ncbi:unnamed protein product [Orchesella dallaii]|uniref:Guanylate-binding protein N-terminal domain-containing protein n=1 Tax=Orchesella dallaii TaxID=48710 RepID=A0ABP1RQS1_9HEXA